MSKNKVSTWPVLYKKTATGAIQQWLVSVEDTTIVTVFGQVGGKLQTTKDSVKSGKNEGRVNGTTAAEQAVKEAVAKWVKQKKAGYCESLKDAESCKTDEIIKGGIVPMTAKVWEDYAEKTSFPVAIQPKLDGHRCLAYIDMDRNVTLWTRTRKEITSVPHIAGELKALAEKKKLQDIYFDGEIYSHDLSNDFAALTSAARKRETSEAALTLQYWIYDIVKNVSFTDRLILLSKWVGYGGKSIRQVDTFIAKDEASLHEYYNIFREKNFEGAMVRSLYKEYEHKRSQSLLKMKDFQDAEFEIIGVEEGRGRLAGHAGAFVCKTKNGLEFRAKMSGSTDKLAEYLINSEDMIGQLLTVKYQGVSNDGIPRFPVGLRIREDL